MNRQIRASQPRTTASKRPVRLMGIYELTKIIVAAALLAGVASGPLVAQSTEATNESAESAVCHEKNGAPAKLVALVREATRKYLDVNEARKHGYEPFLGCVTGPDRGAMGIHYVNGDLVKMGEIDATQPQALIYEPWEGGLRLVGVEFITDYKNWLEHHANPPVLEGQTFQLVASPNRFALDTFFELHVWAYGDNPKGAFVDWNTRVTCEGQ